jgi:hypothetical protein
VLSNFPRYTSSMAPFLLEVEEHRGSEQGSRGVLTGLESPQPCEYYMTITQSGFTEVSIKLLNVICFSGYSLNFMERMQNIPGPS